VSTNPVKLALGLVNAEIEVQIHGAWSLHAAGEYLVADYAISRAEHPDLVLRAGPRWYFWADQDPEVSRAMIGATVGYTWSAATAGYRSLTLGAETGYKLFLSNRLFLLPKLLFTYSLGDRRGAPGLEVMAGATVFPERVP
jgi:hypothetical protein